MQHDIGEDFIFGTELLNPQNENRWNPDSPECSNPHFTISGESGSGKSYLLRDMIRYLTKRKKHIYIIDLHGDLKVDGVEENYIEFTARQSKHGINPFEFDTTDTRNGGVMVQVNTMVAMIKKAFLPSMGPKQEAVLKQLIIDSYHIKGILDNDETTWKNELPSMDTLIWLIENLIRYHSQNSASIPALLAKMDAARRGLAELDYAGYYKQYVTSSIVGVDAVVSKSLTLKKSDDEDDLQETKSNVSLLNADDALGVLKSDSAESIKTEEQSVSHQEEALFYAQMAEVDEGMNYVYELYGDTHGKKIASKLKQIQALQSEASFLLGRFRAFCMFGSFQEMFGVELPECVNPKNYEGKGIIDTLKTLQLYISDIQTSGIFTDVKPPVKPGLNRLDISGLTEEMQSFFVDTFANKIFHALKRRGEYQAQSDKSRGQKVSTYIIIDEGRSILPADKDKESHTQILNRVMNELRKFGGGLGFVSQSPSHFSSAILSAYTKIALKIPENQKKRSMQLLGIKDESMYRLVEQKHTALVGIGSSFKAVALPGYVRPAGIAFPANREIAPRTDDSGKKVFSFAN